MSRPKQSIETKAQKECPEFVSEVQGLAIDALEARFSVLAKAEAENEQMKENDEDLEKAREAAAELAAPYREAKKSLKLKQRFLLALMKEKGATK